MTVENLPDLGLPDMGNVRDAKRPVVGMAFSSEGAHRAAAHSHARAHIIRPLTGAYWVITPEGTWLVPAGLAIWVPPGVHHEVYSHGGVSAQVLFVDPAPAAALPAHCGTVRVTPLLAALIARTLEHGNAYAPGSPAERLARVMLDELAAMDFAPLFLPVSKEPRLARAMLKLMADPSPGLGIEDLARAAGASPRTLARLFRAETGLTFGAWRRNLVLSRAIERLEKGEQVTEVALDLGYGSPSSFTYMFRKRLGVPPRQYRAGAKG